MASAPEPHQPAASSPPPDSPAVVLEVRIALDRDQLAAIAEAVTDLLDTKGLSAPEAWSEWMNIDTAARYLDCTPERLRKLIARRQIPYHQEAPGCRIFFHRPELDHCMSGLRHEARI